jgi:hypothetical protein
MGVVHACMALCFGAANSETISATPFRGYLAGDPGVIVGLGYSGLRVKELSQPRGSSPHGVKNEGLEWQQRWKVL